MKNLLDNTNSLGDLIKDEHKEIAVKLIKTGADIGEKAGQIISNTIDYIVDNTFKK